MSKFFFSLEQLSSFVEQFERQFDAIDIDMENCVVLVEHFNDQFAQHEKHRQDFGKLHLMQSQVRSIEQKLFILFVWSSSERGEDIRYGFG